MNKEFFKDKQEQVDELTGLYRRDVIIQYIDNLISNNKPFSFAILDIDNFKYVNDDHGHLFGDEVLKAIAKKVQQELDNIGVVGRYGGDEFLIILENIVDYNAIWEIYHTLLSVSSNTGDEKIDELNITVTIGSSRFPKDATSIDGLFELGDKALYRGKMKGRNCFIIYLPEKHANINLISSRDRIVSSMYLHTRVYNGITNSKEFSKGITDTINYLGNYFMIDHLCIQTDDKLYFEYFHPLCRKKDFKALTSVLLTKYVNPTIGIYYRNTFLYGELASPIDKSSLEEGIYSSAYIELRFKNKLFGYVRADITENVRGRIWQNLDLDVLLTLAHTLAQELYYKNIKVEDIIK